jgi:hypothetical protein
MRSAIKRSGFGALQSTPTELAQLRVRVIALLAQAPERQFLLAREMAVHISPRPGFTRHRLNCVAHQRAQHQQQADGLAALRKAQAGP